MVNTRRGGTSLGCLFTLLILAATTYFGFKVGEVYWRFYNYQDTMVQQARFGEHFTNDQIRKRLVAKADSLALPADASEITIERRGRLITIAADYVELVELPLHVRTIRFSPRAVHEY